MPKRALQRLLPRTSPWTLIQSLDYLSLLRRCRRPNIGVGCGHVLVAHHITDREGVVSPVLKVRGEECPQPMRADVFPVRDPSLFRVGFHKIFRVTLSHTEQSLP